VADTMTTALADTHQETKAQGKLATAPQEVATR